MRNIGSRGSLTTYAGQTEHVGQLMEICVSALDILTQAHNTYNA
jgi:hypothetical protein